MGEFSPELGKSEEPGAQGASRWRVILYNDNRHKFDDVVSFLQESTQCKDNFAIEICHVCQDQGRAVCFQGGKESCQDVAAALRASGLQVEVDDYLGAGG